MDALLAQLPDDLPQTAEAKAKPRQRGFSASLLRERIELTLSDEQKAGASKVFFYQGQRGVAVHSGSTQGAGDLAREGGVRA